MARVRTRRIGAITGAIVVAVGALFGAIAHAGRAGVLSLVTPDANLRAITSGDQFTQFVVKPPAGSSCPGDTQHDGWLLVGFILPADDDPAAQTFLPQGPADRYVDGVTRRLALYRLERAPIGVANLPLNPEPGSPVRLPAIPPLTFQQPATLGLAGGRYQIGIGCMHDADLGDYWTAVVDITRPTDLKSPELSWTVAEAAPVDSSDSGPPTVVLVGVGVGVVALAVYLVTRRREKAASLR